MPSPLSESLAKEPLRPAVIDDCVALIDSEVKAKKGLSGVAIKGAYGAIKKIKPRFVREVIDALLDEWLVKLDVHHGRWSAAEDGVEFPAFLTARSDEVAEDLLSVTDERAQATKHGTARKLYLKMRGSAKANVVAAIPRLAAVLEKHVSAVESP